MNISSLNGVLPTAGLGAYVASKAGVSALTRVAALELAERGITVNAVCPGSIDTAITDRPTSPTSTGTPTSGRSRWAAVALRRGRPRRCSTSPRTRARYVTGTNLVIDGGIAAGRLAT